jgi:6-phospho-beta-glucosidase
MKLVVLGGCGVRSPLLVREVLGRLPGLDLTELWLMDIDEIRLRLVGGLCQQLCEQAGRPLRIVCTGDERAALDGADYIVTTIRVGGEYGRVLDEKIALNNGVLGQETTGAGGFAMAMRSIPALLEYARLAERYASRAWIFNFTNPAGLVTQAMHQSGFTRCIGICDGANLAQEDAARWLGISPALIRAEVFGLNHLSYTRKLWVDGQDVLPSLLNDPKFCASSSLRVFDRALLDLMGLYLNEYLYYYYYAEQALEQIQREPQTRGEEILQLNQALLSDLALIQNEENPAAALRMYYGYIHRRSSTYMHYASPSETGFEKARQANSDASFEVPQESAGYAGLTLDLITAMQTGTVLNTAVNIPNRGAIFGLEADDIVEISASVTPSGITPNHIGNMPDQVAHLVQTIKNYERLAVEAILSRSVRKAVHALMSHPLVLSFPRASRLVDEYLNAHAVHVGEWN